MYLVRGKVVFIHRTIIKAYKNNPIARSRIIRTIRLDKENTGRKEKRRRRMGKRRRRINEESVKFRECSGWVD